MSLRFIKSTTPEAAMIKRNLITNSNTVYARKYMKKCLTVEPMTIDDYRQEGRAIAWRTP